MRVENKRENKKQAFLLTVLVHKEIMDTGHYYTKDLAHSIHGKVYVPTDIINLVEDIKMLSFFIKDIRIDIVIG